MSTFKTHLMNNFYAIKTNYFGLLALLFYISFPFNVNGQVIYDDNSKFESSFDGKLNFTVPSGEDRLLVITVCHFGVISDVLFNGEDALLASTSKLKNSPEASSIYYVLLGNGRDIHAEITVIGSSTPFIIAAGSFKNVDQDNPVGEMDGLDGFSDGFNDMLSLNFSTTFGDLVIDKTYALNTVNPIAHSSQVVMAMLDNTNNSVDFGVSFKIADSSSTNMRQNFAITSNLYTYTGVVFNAAPILNPIPTLNQWGLVIYFLLLLNLCVFIYRKHEKNLPNPPPLL